MKHALSVLVILAAVFLVGCTTPSAVMKSWVGEDEAKLLASWGAPDSVMNLDDGRKIYTWKRIWSNQNGVYQGRQTFTVDADGTVTSWSYENMPRLQRTW